MQVVQHIFQGISTAMVLVLQDKTLWLKTTSLVCHPFIKQSSRLLSGPGLLMLHTPQLS